MSEMRMETINLMNTLSDENIEKVLAFVKNLIQEEEDPFYSEENIAELNRRIEDMKHGRNIVTFSDEEWEKFVNAQDIS